MTKIHETCDVTNPELLPLEIESTRVSDQIKILSAIGRGGAIRVMRELAEQWLLLKISRPRDEFAADKVA